MLVRQYRGYKINPNSAAVDDFDRIKAVFRKGGIDLSNFQFSSNLEDLLKRGVYRHLLYYHSFIQPLPNSTVNVHHILDPSVAQIKKRLGMGKMVLSVHDIIPILAKEGRFGSSRQSFVSNLGIEHFFIKQQLKNINEFDKVIVPSVSTAQDLHEVLHVEKNRIKIIPPALGSEFKALPRAVVRKFREMHGLDPKSYWVVISGDDAKQNQRTSLQVLKELNKKSKRRVLLLKVGATDAGFEKMADEYQVREFVRQLDVKDNTEKAIIYNLAHCFLYPSIYSGFGMPVVESVACATPVVTSDRGALKELMPEHVVHINPFDIRALTKEVYRCITRKEVRERFVSESEALVEKYRATKVTAQMIKVYQNLIS